MALVMPRSLPLVEYFQNIFRLTWPLTCPTLKSGMEPCICILGRMSASGKLAHNYRNVVIYFSMGRRKLQSNRNQYKLCNLIKLINCFIVYCATIVSPMTPCKIISVIWNLKQMSLAMVTKPLLSATAFNVFGTDWRIVFWNVHSARKK